MNSIYIKILFVILIITLVIFILPDSKSGALINSTSISESKENNLFIKKMKWEVNSITENKRIEKYINPDEIFIEKTMAKGINILSGNYETGDYNLVIIKRLNNESDELFDNHWMKYEVKSKYFITKEDNVFSSGIIRTILRYAPFERKVLGDTITFSINNDGKTIGELLILDN